jgi:hypothetical protein
VSHGESQDLNTERHQKRADDMGDAIRRYLIGINTGGIGVVVALASRDRGPALGTWGLLVPLLFFVFGIVTIGGSLVLQKHKALKRRDAAKECRSMPDYNRMLWRNQTYDIIAGVLFIIGVVFGVLGLLCRDKVA